MSAPKRAPAARAADELNRYRWRIVREVRHVFQRAADANWEDAGATQFYESWQTLLQNDSLSHQAVYIPLPWRFIMEKEVRGDGVLDGFVWLLDWWRTLQFGRHRHFVTLLQCSTSQMKRAALLQLNRTFSFPDDVRKTTAYAGRVSIRASVVRHFHALLRMPNRFCSRVLADDRLRHSPFRPRCAPAEDSSDAQFRSAALAAQRSASAAPHAAEAAQISGLLLWRLYQRATCERARRIAWLRAISGPAMRYKSACQAVGAGGGQL